MAADVIMPALGMAQDSGLIVAWLKAPGDRVAKGDALFEVETDKATMEVEAQAGGFLSAVAAKAGDEVPVGRVIARIVATEAEVERADALAAPASPPVAPSPPAPAVAPAAAPAAAAAGQQVIMPALGMAQDSGLIVAWLKAPGDPVAKGEPLFAVETDKATMEVEAQAGGFLSAVAALAGDTVPVGRVIARIVATRAEVTAAAPDAPAGGVAAPSSQPVPSPVAATSAAAQLMARVAGRILASPKARRLARERGLDLGRLAEMGHPQPYHVADLARLEDLAAAPRADFVASPATRALAGKLGVDLGALAARTGRTFLAREDVLAGPAAALPAAVPAAPSPWAVDHAAFGPVREENLPRFARIAAATLAIARSTIPAVTHHDSADVRRVEAIRATLKAEGRKVTALAFHVAALASCLRAFPRFNASLGADGETLILKDYVHIGIAIDAPYGLVVPVIREADRKSVTEIAEAIAALAARAQDRKLRPDEMGGASMTISNLGGIGGEAFTPIINPPELAILGITRTEIRPVWDGAAFQPVPMVPLDLTYDHRVINGADAARFLARYRELIATADTLKIAAG